MTRPSPIGAWHCSSLNTLLRCGRLLSYNFGRIRTTANLAWKEAERPYCTVHNRWYAQREHLGGVERDQASQLLQLLRAGNFSQAGAMLEENAALPSVELYLQSCDHCQPSDSRLQIETVSAGRGQMQARQYLKAALSPAERYALIRGAGERVELRDAATKAL